MAGKDGFKEKRTGPDLLVKWVKVAGIVSWLFIIPILFITDKAKPKLKTFFDTLLGINPRSYWDIELMQYVYYLMVVMLALSAISLVINSRRLKRAGDKLSRALIANFLLSLFGIILYIINF